MKMYRSSASIVAEWAIHKGNAQMNLMSRMMMRKNMVNPRKRSLEIGLGSLR
jgi:hypothetical protein